MSSFSRRPARASSRQLRLGPVRARRRSPKPRLRASSVPGGGTGSMRIQLSAPRKIRTSDTWFRRPVLYPAELWAPLRPVFRFWETPPPWAGGISAGVRDDTHAVRSVNVPFRWNLRSLAPEVRSFKDPAEEVRAPAWANPAKFLPLCLDRDPSAPLRPAGMMCALVKTLRFRAVAWGPDPIRGDGTYTAECHVGSTTSPPGLRLAPCRPRPISSLPRARPELWA